MKKRAPVEPREDEEASLVLSVFIAAIIGWGALCGAFVYKVWNERQMTREYHEQSKQLRHIADTLDIAVEAAYPVASHKIYWDRH